MLIAVVLTSTGSINTTKLFNCDACVILFYNLFMAWVSKEGGYVKKSCIVIVCIKENGKYSEKCVYIDCVMFCLSFFVQVRWIGVPFWKKYLNEWTEQKHYWFKWSDYKYSSAQLIKLISVRMYCVQLLYFWQQHFAWWR